MTKRQWQETLNKMDNALENVLRAGVMDKSTRTILQGLRADVAKFLNELDRSPRISPTVLRGIFGVVSRVIQFLMDNPFQ